MGLRCPELGANRDRLIEGYGDGSPEQIKKFVQSVRSNEVSDEFVDASFEILPDAFKKSLSGKGQVTNDKYVSDDKAHKDIHYLGKNEDGTIRRGPASNKDKKKHMWRIYLEQGGRDATQDSSGYSSDGPGTRPWFQQQRWWKTW